MAEFWTDYITQSLAPGFLQGPNGAAFLQALGEEKDDLRAQMMDAIKLRFPSKCDSSAYLMHAQRRQLDVVPGESNAQTLARILNVFPTKVLGGTDEGILDALRSFGIGATDTYGVPRTNALGLPTVVVKHQRDFSPSWDFERFTSLPSWAVTYGSGYRVADTSTFMTDGYLGIFEVKCRFRYAWANQVADEYLWYVNYSTNCYLRKSDGKVVLKLNGYSLVSNYGHIFAKGDVVAVKITHTSSNLTMVVDGYDSVFGAVQGPVAEPLIFTTTKQTQSWTIRASNGAIYWFDWGDGTSSTVIGNGADQVTMHDYGSAGTRVILFGMLDWTKLLTINCASNGLTGTFPSLGACVNLLTCYGYTNAFSGVVPSFAPCTKLQILYFDGNQFTSYVRQVIPSTCYTFTFYGNKLDVTAANGMLADLALGMAGRPANGSANLSSGTNAAPTGQGLLDKATIAARPWTCTTN